MSRKYGQDCDVARLELLLRTEQDLSRYKRILCVYLRVSCKLKAKEISKVIGRSLGGIWNLQGDYKKRGELAFDVNGKGGRQRENITLSEEREVLSSVESTAISGGILEIGKVKAAYEKKLGRKAHKSAVYRMLHRHNWRKLAPRKRHPKNDKRAMETFKKNSHHWCRVQTT